MGGFRVIGVGGQISSALTIAPVWAASARTLRSSASA